MDELRRLVENARALAAEGYYRPSANAKRSPSFLNSLGTASAHSTVIAEIKFASPTRPSENSPTNLDTILNGIVAAGPLGLSVLAEPRIFGGHLDHVRIAATRGLPVLMKDIIVDAVQVEAAASTGASTILLIETLFRRGLVEHPSQTLIDMAHARDLDVVLEVHTLEEWDAAVKTDADVLGINNRDLATMRVDLSTTPSLLLSRRKDRPVISMSGIDSRSQVEAMLRAGADAVLVGTSIMADPDPRRKLEALLNG